jgi:hypothetical protein
MEGLRMLPELLRSDYVDAADRLEEAAASAERKGRRTIARADVASLARADALRRIAEQIRSATP